MLKVLTDRIYEDNQYRIVESGKVRKGWNVSNAIKDKILGVRKYMEGEDEVGRRNLMAMIDVRTTEGGSANVGDDEGEAGGRRRGLLYSTRGPG